MTTVVTSRRVRLRESRSGRTGGKRKGEEEERRETEGYERGNINQITSCAPGVYFSLGRRVTEKTERKRESCNRREERVRGDALLRHCWMNWPPGREERDRTGWMEGGRLKKMNMTETQKRQELREGEKGKHEKETTGGEKKTGGGEARPGM